MSPLVAFLLRLFYVIATLVMLCGNEMATNGLPVGRRERGIDEQHEDILAGNDFLSVFLESSLRRARKETTIAPEDDSTLVITEAYARTSREANNYFETTASAADDDEGVVISMHVSSSVESKINKDKATENHQSFSQQDVVSSEDRPSLVANAEKSELNVEEPAPITIETSLPKTHFAPSGTVHSFIYHDSPKGPGRARSVSYSTIVQGIGGDEKTSSPPPLERKERNYETDQGYQNSFDTSRKKVLVTSTSTTTTRPLPKVYSTPEQNYEVDEAVSVVTNGRTHGVQQEEPGKTEKEKEQKVGYVVEGRNYRKYRVEERTSDGFIVGEYGVVSHDDGSLRGVRYTADGTINPRLIYDALMKFLSL